MKHISKLSSRIYFSKYPCEELLAELPEVDLIVDLTTEDEGLPEYETEIEVMKVPIVDRRTLPDNEAIDLVRNIVSKGRVLIHCRGGGGRSAVIAGLLLGYLKNLPADVVIGKLSQAFEKREIKSEKLIRLGAPQTKVQKDQLKKLLRPFDFYGTTFGPWSNFSPHSVQSSHFNLEFSTSEALFQAYKDDEIVEKLSKCEDPKKAKAIGRKCDLRPDWETVKVECMLETLRDKVSSNPFIVEELEKTGIRPMYERCQDNIWGDGLDRSGQNLLGKCWSKIRLENL